MRPVSLEERLGHSPTMQRFFIKLDAPYPVDDDEGHVYPSAEHARDDAIQFLADLLKERAQDIQPGERWGILVYDETSTLICRLGFTIDHLP